MKNELTGTIMMLGVVQTPGTLVSTRMEQIHATLEGFRGDRHSGFIHLSDGRTPRYPKKTPIRNYRQLSLVSAEELELTARELGIPTLEPEWYGANLCISGIERFTLLPAGTRLYCEGGVSIYLTGENDPCMNVGRIVQGHFPEKADLAAHFVATAMHRRGVVGVIECAGLVRAGEQVEVEIPRPAPNK